MARFMAGILTATATIFMLDTYVFPELGTVNIVVDPKYTLGVITLMFTASFALFVFSERKVSSLRKRLRARGVMVKRLRSLTKQTRRINSVLTRIGMCPRGAEEFLERLAAATEEERKELFAEEGRSLAESAACIDADVYMYAGLTLEDLLRTSNASPEKVMAFVEQLKGDL